MSGDDLLILDDDEPLAPTGKPWRVLVVDDEIEVHDITLVALSDFTFNGRPLEFSHAYSGAEAASIVDQSAEFAVMLVDVVMESDHAGLDFVRYVRETAGQHFPRIILRTGQPGQAPERQVITEYDINDYKQKTELTQEKMFSTMYTSIASYRDLIALDSNRRGLYKVIDSIAELFEFQSMEQFAQGVLEQLAALLYIDREALVLSTAGLATEKANNDFEILAGTGVFSSLVGKRAREALPPELFQRLSSTLHKQEPYTGEGYFATVYSTTEGIHNVLYIASDHGIGQPDRDLIELFCKNVGKAQDNLMLINRKLSANAG